MTATVTEHRRRTRPLRDLMGPPPRPPGLNCWYVTAEGADVVEAAGRHVGARRMLLTPDSAGGMLQRHTLAVNDVGIAFVRWAGRHGHDCDHRSWRHEVAHRTSDQS